MLFCLTADYTPQALNAMRENPNSNRQAAVEELLAAAGGTCHRRRMESLEQHSRLADGPRAEGRPARLECGVTHLVAQFARALHIPRS